MVGLPAGFCYQRARRLPSPWPHHHRRAAQNKGRPPETSGPSAAMLRPVSMTSVRAAEGESNSACENTNSVRTRHTRNAPAAVPDAVEHSGLGRALTRAEGLRLRPVVSLSPRDNVRGPLAPPPRTRHHASGQVRTGPGLPRPRAKCALTNCGFYVPPRFALLPRIIPERVPRRLRWWLSAGTACQMMRI